MRAAKPKPKIVKAKKIFGLKDREQTSVVGVASILPKIKKENPIIRGNKKHFKKKSFSQFLRGRRLKVINGKMAIASARAPTAKLKKNEATNWRT